MKHFSILGSAGLGIGLLLNVPAIAQQSGCPAPALSRLVRHTVKSGETLESIATRYNLIPSTLMGLNPSVRSGKVTTGETLLVPPFNGIRVEVPAGQTWREVAKQYRVRPDVLFEVNGCQRSPRIVFIPGVNWSPVGGSASPTVAASSTVLSGYPLPQRATILLGYGWYIPAGKDEPIFHPGLDLAASSGTPVRSLSNGTVAFAGIQGPYGNLVVINHQKGYQTRYAQMGSIKVKTGQTVKAGTIVGTVGRTGTPSTTQPHLHFEVRSNSKVGWVAEDPSAFIRQKQ